MIRSVGWTGNNDRCEQIVADYLALVRNEIQFITQNWNALDIRNKLDEVAMTLKSPLSR